MSVLSGLLEDLLQEKVLSTENKDFVLESQTTKKNRAYCLINMVIRKGERASQMMVDSLKVRGPELWVQLRLTDGELSMIVFFFFKAMKLRRDYITLLDSLTVHNKYVFVSGPLPPLNRGIDRFSCTLSFHTCLQSTCATRNTVFIDNFNLLWNRPAFFRPDGIHPNVLGSRILTDNLFYSIYASRS